jgi:PadR family transcriptional regulator, regulatory protein PadR
LSERDEGRRGDPSGSIGRNIEPFLLLELLRAPSYGYDLIRRLAEAGFRRATDEPAMVYKVLRSLEDAGSICSSWSPQESGPARRYYEITDLGRSRLRQRIGHLRRYVERVEWLLADYVALTGESPDSEPPGDGSAAPAPTTSAKDTGIPVSTTGDEGTVIPVPTIVGVPQ